MSASVLLGLPIRACFQLSRSRCIGCRKLVLNHPLQEAAWSYRAQSQNRQGSQQTNATVLHDPARNGTLTLSSLEWTPVSFSEVREPVFDLHSGLQMNIQCKSAASDCGATTFVGGNTKDHLERLESSLRENDFLLLGRWKRTVDMIKAPVQCGTATGQCQTRWPQHNDEFAQHDAPAECKELAG